MSVGRILVLLLGITGVLVAIGLLFGGGAVLWVDTTLPDREGFINTRTVKLQSGAYAVVTKPAEIDLGGVWIFDYKTLATLRIESTNTDPSRGVFLGITTASDLDRYLDDVAHDEIVDLSIRPYRVDYQTHPGNSVPTAPNTETFWVASVAGTGRQTLTWDLAPGSYSLVLMNEDGSAGVDLETRIGAKVPLLRGVGIGLVTGGAVALLLGSFLIHLAVRRQRLAAKNDRN
jgi:hypothetical protein